MRACLQYGILVSAVSGAALFFLSDFFAMEWLRDLRAAPRLRVMGLLLPFSCLCGIMTGYYTACSRIRQLVGIEIAERLRSGAGVLRHHVPAAPPGVYFDFTLLYLRYRRDMRRVPRERIPMRKRLLRLSVPLALNDALRAGLNHGRAAAHPPSALRALRRLDGGGYGGLWDDPRYGVPPS